MVMEDQERWTILTGNWMERGVYHAVQGVFPSYEAAKEYGNRAYDGCMWMPIPIIPEVE